MAFAIDQVEIVDRLEVFGLAAEFVERFAGGEMFG